MIMTCVSSVRYQVKFNCGVTDTFIPNCGLRQGDPLSPHLNILCRETLFQTTNAYQRQNLFSIPRIAPRGLHITLLQFSDDLFFIHPTKKSLLSPSNILQSMLKKLVKLVTSQRVNFFFSISALPSVIQSTKNILWVSLPPLNLFNI